MPADGAKIIQQLGRILSDPAHGKALKDDLRQGMHTLPIWMQSIVRELIEPRRRSPPPA
jgi:hypothetical protein